MNQKSIHQDQRLHHLDPEQLSRLTKMAEQLSNTPDSQKMAVFLSIMQDMRASQLSFSPTEQELLFHVLTEHMSEQEKKRAMMIRQLSAQLMKNK